MLYASCVVLYCGACVCAVVCVCFCCCCVCVLYVCVLCVVCCVCGVCVCVCVWCVFSCVCMFMYLCAPVFYSVLSCSALLCVTLVIIIILRLPVFLHERVCFPTTSSSPSPSTSPTDYTHEHSSINQFKMFTYVQRRMCIYMIKMYLHLYMQYVVKTEFLQTKSDPYWRKLGL